MQDVIINWDKSVFDGINRKLPNTLTLYTQIYLNDGRGSWSLVFNFELPPNEQGLNTLGKVNFMFDNAPKEVLKKGFKFDFMDGKNKVGTCEII